MKQAEQIMQELAEPFPENDIEWRVGRAGKKGDKVWAMVLAYISNRAIQQRLDDVLGVFGWRNEFKEWHGTSQICGISVLNDGNWITKWDGADVTDIEGTKGGLSDSMKRAGVQWGIGRYLYKMPTNFVNENKGGRLKGQYKDNGTTKYFNYAPPKLPDSFLPKEKFSRLYKDLVADLKEVVDAATKKTWIEDVDRKKNELTVDEKTNLKIKLKEKGIK